MTAYSMANMIHQYYGEDPNALDEREFREFVHGLEATRGRARYYTFAGSSDTDLDIAEAAIRRSAELPEHIVAWAYAVKHCYELEP